MSASYWRARPPGGRGVLCAALVAACAAYPRYVGANDCAKVKALADCESTTMMGLEVVEGGGGLLTVTRASGEALGAGATYEPREQLTVRRMEEDAPPEEDDRDDVAFPRELRLCLGHAGVDPKIREAQHLREQRRGEAQLLDAVQYRSFVRLVL